MSKCLCLTLFYRYQGSDKVHSSLGTETLPSSLALSGPSAQEQFAVCFLSTNCQWSQAFVAEMEIRDAG